MEPDLIRSGERLLNLGRFEEALACFSGCDDSPARFGMAVALHLLGRFDEAQARYEEVLATDRGHREALANLIAMNVERFDLERVEKYSRRLLEIDPGSLAGLQGLVVIAVERGDYETAARLFGRIVPGECADDAIEYRLSRQIMERLRSCDGAIADPD